MPDKTKPQDGKAGTKDADDKDTKTGEDTKPGDPESDKDDKKPKGKEPEDDDADQNDVDSDDADDDDDNEDLGDEKLIQVSQARIDAMVKRRLAKQEKSLNKTHQREIMRLTNKIEAAEKATESFRALVATSVQTEVDALPDEIKAMAPAKTDSAAGLKKVQEWLPNAKALAAKLPPSDKKPDDKKQDAKPPQDKKADEVNAPDPKPAGGGNNSSDSNKSARRPALYRRF